MPGKLGIRPVHSSFSVPDETPLQSISTRTSPDAIGFSVRDRNASLSGASSMTATASICHPLQRESHRVPVTSVTLS